eukprot:SAG31_NODE_42201_length_272_cov_1.202312_1_plen_43_part_01
MNRKGDAVVRSKLEVDTGRFLIYIAKKLNSGPWKSMNGSPPCL